MSKVAKGHSLGLPWRVVKLERAKTYAIFRAGLSSVGTFDKEIAETISAAVNSHDALVAALEELLSVTVRYAAQHDYPDAQTEKVICDASAALKLAGGE